MTCPRCSGSLHEIDRDGVTIDRCEKCRGVWLDRGELEKLVSRDRNGRGDDDDDDDDNDRRRDGGKRRSSWWEIFD